MDWNLKKKTCLLPAFPSLAALSSLCCGDALILQSSDHSGDRKSLLLFWNMKHGEQFQGISQSVRHAGTQENSTACFAHALRAFAGTACPLAIACRQAHPSRTRHH